MLRAIKYELNPTKIQREQIRKTCGCCRLVYNTMLDRRITAYKDDKKSISFFDLCKQITLLRQEKEFLKECSVAALQQAVRNMDTAYKSFFKKNGGFPKFKKKGCRDSFRIPFACVIDYDIWRIKVPKIGWIKFYKGHNKQIDGKIHSYTISCTP